MNVYKALYPYLPPRNFGRLWHLYFRLTPHLGRRFPIVRIRGRLRGRSDDVALAVATRSRWLTAYVSRSLFAASPCLEPVGTSSIAHLPARLRPFAEDGAVTIASLDSHNAHALFGSDHLLLPAWITFAHRLRAGSLEDMERTDSVRADLRVLRREGLHPVYSTDAADLDQFYDRYYLPTLRHRYGGEAFIHRRRWLRNEFRRGFMLWIERGGERIAGSIITLREGDLELVACGLRDGDRSRATRGGYAATYHFGNQRARELGARVVDFGASHPFLNDGIVFYKRKWGGSVVGPSHISFEDVAVGWRRWSATMATLLNALGVVFRDGTGLSSLYAGASSGPAGTADVERALHRVHLPGLRRMCLVSEQGWCSEVRAPPGCELMVVQDATSSEELLTKLRTGLRYAR